MIEIRDARLALRAFLDAEVAATARADAEGRGLGGLAAAAFVEAAVLRAAVHAQRDGEAVARPWAGRGVEGASMTSETEWFTAVAEHFEAAGVTRRNGRGRERIPSAERRLV